MSERETSLVDPFFLYLRKIRSFGEKYGQTLANLKNAFNLCLDNPMNPPIFL